MRTKIFQIFFYIFSFSTASIALRIEETEQTLSDMLLQNYTKYIRGSTLVVIYLKMQLKQIVEINERSQIITTHFHLTPKWLDERLRWNPMEQSFAAVNFDGSIYFAAPAQIRTRCALDMRNFPFDSQKCTIAFASWINAINRAGMSMPGSFFDLTEFVNNSLWDVTSLSLRQTFMYSKNPYENYPANSLQLDLNFKRKPIYYLVNGVLPCFLLNIVTLISYWIPFNPQISLSKLALLL